MDSLTTITTVTISQFTGLRTRTPTNPTTVMMPPSLPKSHKTSVRASLKDAGVAIIATAATAVLATSGALAKDVEVLLGGNNGELAFVPSQVEIKAGDRLVFKNNSGYPHNVLFDEDEVPPGVDVGSISMDESDLLNGPGDAYTVVLKDPGNYGVYCAPHQGAGMVGKVVVN